MSTLGHNTKLISRMKFPSAQNFNNDTVFKNQIDE